MNDLSDLPRRPADVDRDATAVELLDCYHRHLVPLTAARVDAARPPTPQLVRHALAALATSETIVDDLRGERWPIVIDALRHGATVAQVGAAMADLDAEEIRVGLTSWADRLRGNRTLTDAEHAALVALATPGAGR